MRSSNLITALRTAALVFVACIAQATSAKAQQLPVQFAGMAQYEMTIKGRVARASASADQVINSSDFTFQGVRVILALSKKAYTAGASVSGSTIASTFVGLFPARTYYNNISLSGSGAAIKGKNLRVLMLALDAENRIVGGLTFNKKLSVKAMPLTAQALGLVPTETAAPMGTFHELR